MVLQIMLNSGWQCKSLFGYRCEPLYAYPSTFIQVPGFPKMGVPPKPSISIGCSIVDHPAIGVPMGPSISGTQHMLLRWQKFHQGFPTGFPAIACIGISPGGPWVRIDCIDAVRLRRRLSEHVLFCHGYQIFMGILRSHLQKNVYYASSIYGFYFLFGHVIIQTCVSSLVYHPYQLSLKKSGPQIRSPLDRGKVLGGPGSAWILGTKSTKSMIFSSHHFPYMWMQFWKQTTVKGHKASR